MGKEMNIPRQLHGLAQEMAFLAKTIELET
jgi:hypothetical protein